MEMTGQTPLVSDVAGEWLEVGDDQIDLRVIDKVVQPGKAPGGLRNGDQILRDGALVADAIVDVGETESVDLGDVEIILQILQAAVERGDMDAVSLGDEMRQNFFGAGGVACAFAVYSVEDVGHGFEGRVYRACEAPPAVLKFRPQASTMTSAAHRQNAQCYCLRGTGRAPYRWWRVVAELDVKRVTFRRRDRQRVFDKAFGDCDRVGEIGIGADRIEQEQFVSAQRALLFWAARSGQPVSMGTRTRFTSDCQSPLMPSPATGRNFSGPKAEGPRSFMGSRTASTVFESCMVRLPSLKLSDHAEGFVGGGDFDFLAGRKVSGACVLRKKFRRAILRQFFLAAQTNRRAATRTCSS